MKNQYVDYYNVTREVLDTIKIGDFVKCNEWKKPMKVMGVSKNYFVMIQNLFGKMYYSVCEKKPSTHSRNMYSEGSFRIGRDDYIFGSAYGYEFNNEDDTQKYLAEFESSETQLSVRAAVNLNNISIKYMS